MSQLAYALLSLRYTSSDDIGLSSEQGSNTRKLRSAENTFGSIFAIAAEFDKQIEAARQIAIILLTLEISTEPNFSVGTAVGISANTTTNPTTIPPVTATAQVLNINDLARL